MVRRISLDYGNEGYVNLNIWSYSLERRSRYKGKNQISLTRDIGRHCLITLFQVVLVLGFEQSPGFDTAERRWYTLLSRNGTRASLRSIALTIVHRVRTNLRTQAQEA